MGTKIKVALALVGLAAAGVGLGAFSNFTDGGVDVRSTRCEDISSARLSIATELESRKKVASDALHLEREAASNAYWAQNQVLEGEYYECISGALMADPCKKSFERTGELYEEIMADFAADKGFNEAKFNEREEVKKEYNKCVEDARKPEFYKDKEAQCNANLAAGREADQKIRTESEAAAQVRYNEAVVHAESAYKEKSGIIDAIERKCDEAGGKTDVLIGALGTEMTGAVIALSSQSCTGVFPGNDPEILKQISNIESQLQKAKAGGQREGISGTDHLQEALDRLRQELKDSPRTCTTDADCGSEPVCCSGTEVGRAYCSNGSCAAKKTECASPEICAGKPAQCLAPSQGAQQQGGVYISRTIPEKGPCSQNLQVLTLEQATPDSVRYSVVGNIPNWLHLDKPNGTLPGKVNVTYSCNTVQAFGPGVYTAGGSITVHNVGNELINTIPLNVSITVTKSEKMVDVIDYKRKLIPLSEVHTSTGPECDKEEHWHAKNTVAVALDGSQISDPGDCGFGKTKDVPVRTVPDTRKEKAGGGTIEVRGLEFLKGQ